MVDKLHLGSLAVIENSGFHLLETSEYQSDFLIHSEIYTVVLLAPKVAKVKPV